MIKKISQLSPLNTALSAGHSEIYQNMVLGPLSAEAKDATVFEASFKNRENDEDHSGYYSSFQCTLTDLEHYTGLDWMRDIVRQFKSEKVVISNDMWIGLPEDPMPDGVDEYYPDSDHNLSVFSKSSFENDIAVHGAANFHGPAQFFKVINGVAYRAQWGDLGEYYRADEFYEPGTLLQFGGSEEVTIAKTDVNAVASTNPGMVLNSQDAEKSVVVAVCGKVPVKVIGKVHKFDRIALSNVPGVGRASNSLEDKKIAVALEDNEDDDVKLVLCSTQMRID